MTGKETVAYSSHIHSKIALEASKVPAKLTQGLDRSSEDRESGDGLIAPPSTPVLKETFFSTWPEEVADETWEVKVGLPLRRQHGKVDLAGWVKAAMTDYHGATHTTERSPPVTPELEPASSTSDTTSSIGPIELAGNLPRRSRFYL